MSTDWLAFLDFLRHRFALAAPGLACIFALCACALVWLLAFRIERRARRDERPIKIRLLALSRTFDLPTRLPRARLTVGELLSLIALSATDGEAKLNRFGETFTCGAWDRMHSGETDVLLIPCSDEEIKQFAA